ncbi:unnamed protein product [Caenorhabditis auriculariae]|uniref:Uncharacterized protein n=1 Tax=Caenorhabditis auriculariae TaxID=2777116 RepID=A0A8S1H3K8_9PELO|nr:unnamed protein product [Caenorhabditis auriculariae]
MHGLKSRGATLLASKRCTSSAASAADVTPTATQPPTRKATPATVYRPPYYRKAHRHHEPKHMLQEEFPNAGDASGAGIRLFDYFKTAEIVNSLPTVKEKVDFVSPYERPWSRAERTWRRDWHPTLMATRKAWALPSVPAHIDCLKFYQYLTKTRVESGPLDEYYKGLIPPMAQFEKRSSETIRMFVGTNPETAQKLLSRFIDDAMSSLVHNVHRLADYRVAYDVPSEAFWIRSGFMFLYDEEEIGTRKVVRKLHNFPKFIGDDRRKLGELAFVHRDKLAAQLRSHEQPAPLHSLESEFATRPIFSELDNVDLEDVLFSPKVFNLWPDENPLWQCPGFHVESEETHPYGVLAIKSLADLSKRVNQWAEKDHLIAKLGLFDEAAKAQAVVSLFSTLCAQAHAQGFTQYTDVTRPFTSQLILTDGNLAYFAVGQLNTLAINIECDGFHNPRTNFVHIEGPVKLLERNEKSGEAKLSGQFLERCLQMLMKQ